MLTSYFDKEEVRVAVWECRNNKSLRPDGFHFKLIKEFGHVIKGEFF